MKNLRIVGLVAAGAVGSAVYAGASGHAGSGGGTAVAGAGADATATPQLVLLDTDIGDDIDDAFALALLLKSPELELLGISTAYGDTELRAKLVDRFMAAYCVDDPVPVVPGAPTPQQNVFTQAAYAKGEKHGGCVAPGNLRDRFKEVANSENERKHDDAAGFLLRQIKAHPGEITLIAIGPLFNIEAAIKKDPETFRKLKRVVLMGGSVYRGYGGTAAAPTSPQPEWNILCDPAGLRALLASGVPVFMMPLDSTQIPLEVANREKIFSHGSALTDQLTLLYHQWMAGDVHRTTPTLFDPVAVAYAIRPELCPATPIRLEVDDKGLTRPVDGSPNAQVCLKSDEKGFLDLLLSRITTESTH